MNLNQANRVITNIKAKHFVPVTDDLMTWDVYPTHMGLGTKPVGQVTQKKGQTMAQLFAQVKATFQEVAPVLQNTAHARRVRQALQEMPKNVVRES